MTAQAAHPTADVLIVGRANVDLTVRVPSLPGIGKTVFGSQLKATPGGKSLNQAVAVARLGGRACLIANAGADQWGRLLMTTLTDAGVEATHFQLLPGVSTGAAIIQVTPDGESHVVLARSPGTELAATQVEAAMADVDAPVVVVQLDMPPEPVASALITPGPEVIRIGNLVPAPELDRQLLRHLDLLVVNQHEAATILDAAGDVKPPAAADLLRQFGPSIVIVTAGADGAAYSGPDGSGNIAAPSAPVTDTTGAGDAFLGCLALELSRKRPLADAVAHAVRIGAQAVQHEGALLPPLAGL